VGLSLIGMLCWKRKAGMLSVAPPVFASSVPFIIMMVVGLGGLCTGLSILSAKMKKGAVMILTGLHPTLQCATLESMMQLSMPRGDLPAHSGVMFITVGVAYVGSIFRTLHVKKN
jgi:hypothetical protein